MFTKEERLELHAANCISEQRADQEQISTEHDVKNRGCVSTLQRSSQPQADTNTMIERFEDDMLRGHDVTRVIPAMAFYSRQGM